MIKNTRLLNTFELTCSKNSQFLTFFEPKCSNMFKNTSFFNDFRTELFTHHCPGVWLGWLAGLAGLAGWAGWAGWAVWLGRIFLKITRFSFEKTSLSGKGRLQGSPTTSPSRPVLQATAPISCKKQWFGEVPWRTRPGKGPAATT